MAISTGAAILGGTIASSFFSSKSQKKATDKAAQGVINAQGISEAAAQKAMSSALALYNPAFADISTSLNQARGDILAGRTSAQDVLNQAFSKSSQTLQTSAQQSMNALLGNQPMMPPSALRKPEKFVAQDRRQRMPPPGLPQETIQQPDGTFIPMPTDGAGGIRKGDAGIPTLNYGSDLRGGVNDPNVAIGPFPEGDPRGNYEPNPSTDPMQPLEGELMPSQMADMNYNLQQPQGSYGMEPAISDLRNAAVGQVGALTGGAYDAMQSGQQGYDEAGNIVTGAFGTGMNMLRSGVDRARGDITGQLDQGLSALRGGVQAGRGDIQQSSQSAIGRFDPYAQAGQSALDVEAARSGALGPEAQAQAFAQYNESPGQAWAREQMEKSTLRTQNAIGGVGGANVQKALMRERYGLSSQNYQRDLENLRSLAGRGQQAAGSQAGIETQAGRDMSQLAMRGGEMEIGARQRAGSELGGMEFGAGQYGAGAAERAGSSLSRLAENRGLYTGGMQRDLSRDVSNVYGRTGELTSGLRMNTGQMIAQQLGLSGQQQAQLEQQLGISFANMDQNTAQQLAQLAGQQGGATSGLRTGLAALLANITTGQGSQQANMAMQLGDIEAGGVTNPIGNAINTGIGIYTANPTIFGGNPQPMAPQTSGYQAPIFQAEPASR